MEKQIAEQSADIPVPLVKEESVEVVQFAAQVPVQNRVKEQIAGVLFAQLQHEEIIQVVPITSREPKLNRVRDQIVDVPVRQFSWRHRGREQGPYARGGVCRAGEADSTRKSSRPSLAANRWAGRCSCAADGQATWSGSPS